MPREYLGVIRAYVLITPEDKKMLEDTYGFGWSAVVRDMIADHCTKLRRRKTAQEFLKEMGHDGSE